MEEPVQFAPAKSGGSSRDAMDFDFR